MRCSNHFCGANAIRPYHLPVVANRLRPKSESHPSHIQKRCSERVVAVVLIWWLPLFEKGGCRCSEMVGCKYHLQPSQMAFATLADGICAPPLSNIVHHHFRTSTTRVFEHRSPPFSNADYRRFERCRQPGRIRQADFSNIVCYLRPRGR